MRIDRDRINRLYQLLRVALEPGLEMGLKPDRVKVMGSALFFDDYGDVDLWVDDEATFNMLTHRQSVISGFIGVPIHVIPLEAAEFDNLHHLVTFDNLCATLRMDGLVEVSSKFAEGPDLRFNSDSLQKFNATKVMAHLARKLVLRGYNVDDHEMARLTGLSSAWAHRGEPPRTDPALLGRTSGWIVEGLLLGKAE